MTKTDRTTEREPQTNIPETCIPQRESETKKGTEKDRKGNIVEP